MAVSIPQLLFGALIAIQVVFWPLYAYLVLPRLGDREITVTYGLRHVLLNTYMDEYVEAYLATLEPAARRRWYNVFLRYAQSATFALLVLGVLSLLIVPRLAPN